MTEKPCHLAACTPSSASAPDDMPRPHDRETLRLAAHELRSRGLTVRDIAEALQLTEGAVRSLLQSTSAGAA